MNKIILSTFLFIQNIESSSTDDEISLAFRAEFLRRELIEYARTNRVFSSEDKRDKALSEQNIFVKNLINKIKDYCIKYGKEKAFLELKKDLDKGYEKISEENGGKTKKVEFALYAHRLDIGFRYILSQKDKAMRLKEELIKRVEDKIEGYCKEYSISEAISMLKKELDEGYDEISEECGEKFGKIEREVMEYAKTKKIYAAKNEENQARIKLNDLVDGIISKIEDYCEDNDTQSVISKLKEELDRGYEELIDKKLEKIYEVYEEFDKYYPKKRVGYSRASDGVEVNRKMGNCVKRVRNKIEEYCKENDKEEVIKMLKKELDDGYEQIEKEYNRENRGGSYSYNRSEESGGKNTKGYLIVGVVILLVIIIQCCCSSENK